MLDCAGFWKERKDGRKMEGMLNCVGLWKERKKWEEDCRNSGQCMIVESKKAMGGRWKECWMDCGNVKKIEGMLDSVGL
jgi:hypothetical protein